MARDDSPPFDRGFTFFQGATITADANGFYGGENLEGKEFEFEDTVYGTGCRVRVKVVRNLGTVGLNPGAAALWDTTAGSFGKRVNGNANTDAAYVAGLVDELLNAAPAQYDLFYVVVRGPAKFLQDRAAGANNVINQGDPLIALTAATSGATTSGRLYPATTVDLTAVSTGLASTVGGAVNNRVGRAMSAATTANTTTAIAALVGW